MVINSKTQFLLDFNLHSTRESKDPSPRKSKQLISFIDNLLQTWQMPSLDNDQRNTSYLGEKWQTPVTDDLFHISQETLT